MTVSDWFLKYARMPSASRADTGQSPSTPEQLALAKVLADDLISIGVKDARADEHGYVYGSISANAPDQPAIGLIAHMDVVDDVPSVGVNPRIVKNYDGGVIELGHGFALDPKVFENLTPLVGKDLIVTDGSTLLGADDKAGIAEIMALAQRLIQDDTIKHGAIKLAFTPDEEIGGGAEKLDINDFGADFAYTVDGGELGGIEYENFNAAGARVSVHGVNIHPGTAKDKMKNAALIACEFANMLPQAETPAHTEGYEGFYHLNHIEGAEEQATLSYIIRDHDKQKFSARKAYFMSCAELINQRYGENTLVVSMNDSYYNMRDVMQNHMHVVERARDAFSKLNIKSFTVPIRGGTDGARLSWRGLPCPNLSTGGMNCHGRHECACVQDMEAMVDVLTEIVRAR